jgi:hypothetical protein
VERGTAEATAEDAIEAGDAEGEAGRLAAGPLTLFL